MALVESFQVNHLKCFQHKDTRLVLKHILPVEKTEDVHLVEINKLLFKVIKVEDYICLRPNKHEVNL